MLSELLANVDAAVADYAATAFGAIAEAAGPLVTIGGALILAWWGVQLASGRASAPMSEFLERIAKIAVFAALVAGTAGTFDILYGWFNDVPEAIGAALIGGESPAEALDTFYTQGTSLSKTLFSQFELSGSGLTWALLGLAVFIAAAALAGYGLFLIIFAKIAVAVLIGLAPVFIFLAMFQTTRSWFEGWLRGVLTQAMLLCLTYGFLAFLLFITGDLVGQIEAADAAGPDVTFEDVAAVLLIVIVGVLLLTQAPTLASAVGGGAAVTTLSAWGAAWAYAGGRFGAAASNLRIGGLDVGLGYQRLRNAIGIRPGPGSRDDWSRPVRAAAANRFRRTPNAAREDSQR